MSLMERLRKCAEISGSGDRLARESDIPRNTWQNYVTGKSTPNAAKLETIVRITGVNGHWLLTGEGSMLLADTQPSAAAPMVVDAENLGHAIAAVEQSAAARGIALSHAKRGKLASLVYQYFLLDKAENETAAYLKQLMELVSD